MTGLRAGLRELARYPSAIMGSFVIVGLIVLALYTVVTIPYNEAIRLWRGGEDIWIENPRNAEPAWVNRLPGKNLPVTILRDTREETGTSKQVEALAEDLYDVRISMTFDYPYDDFPSEINLFLEPTFKERQPHVAMIWRTPDGREIRLEERTLRGAERYGISLDRHLERKLGGVPPEVGLFADPASLEEGRPVPLKGRYELAIEGFVFEKDADIDAKLIVYGKVFGLAGTDHRRRDITIALLWGTPIALAFGFLTAVGSTFTSFVIAAVGAWFTGWVDAIIQRLTEVNLILPALPILILISTFYSRSIWVILGVLILLGIFSLSIKVYRAMFLQVKELPYIEAAQAYGSSSLRIIFLYMLPKVAPVLIPGFVTLIPSLIFLETSLAVLGLGDPALPTWGKVLNDAYSNGALYKGQYYWVLGPSIFLMLTGLGFAMVGFALDRIFNPRLREL